MKSAALTAIVILMLSVPGKAQFEGEYIVEGTVARYKGSDTRIWVYKFKAYDPETQISTYDSVPLVNGQFVLNGRLDKPEIITLSIKHPGSKEPDFLSFYAEKGKISVRADELLSRASVEGSSVNDMDHLFREKLAPYRQAWDSLYRLKKHKDTVYVKNIVNPAYARVAKQMDSISASLINTYPRSYRSILSFEGMLSGARVSKSGSRLTEERISMLEQINDKLQEHLKGTRIGVELEAAVKGLRNTNVGDPVQHFSLQGTDGKRFHTKELKGRVFLVDFWGSWCVWCRKGHPHLKELYEKYKSKGFEIVAVALEYGSYEQQVSKWKKAIKDDKMTWQQVLNGKGEDDIVTKYGVGAFPTKLLVDKDGTILLRVTDDHERKLDAMLEKILATVKN